MTGQSNTVVVGVDASPCSDDAVRWAERFAASVGADLRLVTAWGRPMVYGSPTLVGDGDLKEVAQTIVDKAAAGLALPAPRVHGEIAQGDPADVLVAASRGARVLVVGSKGHNPVAAAVLGSVSERCVHNAEVPVVVVR